LQKYS